MTVAELNEKVDILKQLVHNHEKMIDKLRQIIELQGEQIKRLEKSIDVCKKKDDKVITISKQEFMEKAAKIGADIANDNGGLIAADFAIAAATMAFFLFDKEE